MDPEIKFTPPRSECKHLHTEMRLRTIAGGASTVQIQCTTCGKPTSGALKKTSLTSQALSALPLFDDELLTRGRSADTEKWTQRRAEIALEQQGKSAEWWARYNEYLRSPRWREKRKLVLERDNYLCQGCRKAQATCVHHLTYDHVLDELLWELESACDDCHQRAHPNKIL